MKKTPLGELSCEPEANVVGTDPAMRGMKGRYTHVDRTFLKNKSSNIITAAGVAAFKACWTETSRASKPRFMQARSSAVNTAIVIKFPYWPFGDFMLTGFPAVRFMVATSSSPPQC